MTESDAILALLNVPGVGHVSANRLLKLAASRGAELSDWFFRSLPDLTEELGVEWSREIEFLVRVDEALVRRAGVLSERVSEAGGYFVVSGGEEYPDFLSRGLGDTAPPVLTLLGASEILEQPKAAVVGARNALSASLRIASACSAKFGDRDVAVVSGGAPGVDAAAHEAALSAHGTTIVVLPQGILTCRLPEPLQQGLEDGRVLLMSGFQPDAQWSAQGALTRNGQICALSTMVCAIEPRETGGTVHAAASALKLGVPVSVFSVDEDNEAVVRLMREGATSLLNNKQEFSVDHLWKQWEAATEQDTRTDTLF